MNIDAAFQEILAQEQAKKFERERDLRNQLRQAEALKKYKSDLEARRIYREMKTIG